MLSILHTILSWKGIMKPMKLMSTLLSQTLL